MTEPNSKKNVLKLQKVVIDGLEDVKAQDIKVFNTEKLSPLFERVIVATGSSNRQTKALASSVRDAVREAGFFKPRVEGEENGEWIIVDCGAVVAHIMQPAIRQYYHLEEIWGESPVRFKHGEDKMSALVKERRASAPKEGGDSTAKDSKRTSKVTGTKKRSNSGSSSSKPSESTQDANFARPLTPKARAPRKSSVHAEIKTAQGTTSKAKATTKTKTTDAVTATNTAKRKPKTSAKTVVKTSAKATSKPGAEKSALDVSLKRTPKPRA